ncbi:MAG: DUF2061 domain-containing protein [Patescibacteria group bacterium]
MIKPVETSSRLRSLVKTISWRVVATGITGVIVFMFTGELYETTFITLTCAFVLMLAYYFHERIWSGIR